MKSSERKVLLNQINRLEDELAREKEENRILKQHVNNIENYRLEYEKLIAEVKEELQAVKDMKEYFGKLKDGFAEEISGLQ